MTISTVHTLLLYKLNSQNNANLLHSNSKSITKHSPVFTWYAQTIYIHSITLFTTNWTKLEECPQVTCTFLVNSTDNLLPDPLSLSRCDNHHLSPACYSFIPCVAEKSCLAKRHKRNNDIIQRHFLFAITNSKQIACHKISFLCNNATQTFLNLTINHWRGSLIYLIILLICLYLLFSTVKIIKIYHLALQSYKKQSSIMWNCHDSKWH